jgi:hypothetical protein
MGEGANDEVIDPVKCDACGSEFFTLVKEISNDTCIERTLRCVKCNTLRIDRACLPPAHAL